MANLRGIFEDNRGDGRALLLRANLWGYRSALNGALLCNHLLSRKDFTRSRIKGQRDGSCDDFVGGHNWASCGCGKFATGEEDFRIIFGFSEGLPIVRGFKRHLDEHLKA